MWRHGDVLIAPVEGLPAEAKRRIGSVLAYGEITGHSHRFQDPETVQLWEQGGMLFAEVVADEATIIHEEHQPITLPRGVYRVWMQREYTPQAIRTVQD